MRGLKNKKYSENDIEKNNDHKKDNILLICGQLTPQPVCKHDIEVDQENATEITKKHNKKQDILFLFRLFIEYKIHNIM